MDSNNLNLTPNEGECNDNSSSVVDSSNFHENVPSSTITTSSTTTNSTTTTNTTDTTNSNISTPPINTLSNEDITASIAFENNNEEPTTANSNTIIVNEFPTTTPIYGNMNYQHTMEAVAIHPTTTTNIPINSYNNSYANANRDDNIHFNGIVSNNNPPPPPPHRNMPSNNPPHLVNHHHNLNTHFYGNNPVFYGNHIPNQRSASTSNSTGGGVGPPPHRHYNNNPNYSTYTQNTYHGTIVDPNNNYLVNNNYHASNNNGGVYEHQYNLNSTNSMNGSRNITPHMSSTNRSHATSPINNNNNGPNNLMHFNTNNNATNTGAGGGRYSQISSNNNNNMIMMLNGNEMITPEMMSVANTTTMHAFGNESVCTHINNILSQSTKDHQAIVMATKSSANKILHDRNNSLMQLSNGAAGLVENDVSEILRATGFDANTQNRPSQYNHMNNKHMTTAAHERFNSHHLRHSHVIKPNNHQIFMNELVDTMSSTIGGVSRTTSIAESQSERISTTTNHHYNHHNNNNRTNDPYMNNSHKTGADFEQNEFDHLHQSIRSGAIDLSISSDEDHRNMEFGPIGSNPRKIHYFQQQPSNQVLLPSNFNTPTTVRRRSQYGSSIQMSNNQKAKNSTVTMPSSSTKITNNNITTTKRNSDSHVVATRTRSLCHSPDTQNRIKDDEDIIVNELSGFSIDQQDFPDLKCANNATNIICLHNILKTFCTICQSGTPPVPHESVLTRMSAAASTYTTTSSSTYNFTQSTRHSVCEFRPQSDIPRPPPPPAHPQRQYFHKNSVNTNNSKVVVDSTTSTTKREVFSRKVFVGGLPQDITETQIALEFKRFGELVVDWPHKLDSNSGLPPKGYAFLLFEQAESVVNLINRCSKVDEKFFWAVSSQRSESKQVQIRPWTITDAVWSARDPIEKPVPRCKRTVFVGGIPRQAQARELFENMNQCFGGVDLVEIDVDLEYSYPKGAASVTFDNDECYIKALEAHFISLKLCGMEKRVEIKPFFSDDQNCEECGIQMNSRSGPSSNNNNNQNGANQPIGQCFCVARGCLKYFCENCWSQHQIEVGHMQPQQNKSNGYHRQFQFRRTASHNNSNSNSTTYNNNNNSTNKSTN